MVTLIYGKDTFRSREYLTERIDAYHKKYPQSFSSFAYDGETDDQNTILDAARTPSFFNEKKLIVLKNGFASGALGAFIEAQMHDQDMEFVVYELEGETELKKKDKNLFTRLAKAAVLKEFSPLSPSQVRTWTLKRLSNRGFSAAKEIIDQLTTSSGHDLWRLNNEIEKLIAHAHASGRSRVIADDRPVLTSAKEEINIFKTLDTLFTDKAARALELLERHLAQGDDPVYMVSMIAYQLRNLLTVKDYQEREINYATASKKTKLHPFVLKKMYATAAKIKKDDIIRKFNNLSTLDREVKYGDKPKLSICKFFLI